MGERIKGALILLPFALAFFCGEIVFSILSIIVGAIAFTELTKTFREKKISLSPASAIILIIFLLFNIFSSFKGVDFIFMVIVEFFFFATMLIFQKQKITDIAINFFCLFYAFIPFWMISELYVRNINLAILVFIISFSTDIFAYISGKLFGKHKLIPKVSPKKTVEGSIGAIICTLGIGIACSYIMDISLLLMIPISLFGSVVAQLGDLFASSIKRYCGVKDFSNLIPGHGGILDRFDSVIFVSLLINLFF